jgi:hypothetical protein
MFSSNDRKLRVLMKCMCDAIISQVQGNPSLNMGWVVYPKIYVPSLDPGTCGCDYVETVFVDGIKLGLDPAGLGWALLPVTGDCKEKEIWKQKATEGRRPWDDGHWDRGVGQGMPRTALSTRGRMRQGEPSPGASNTLWSVVPPPEMWSVCWFGHLAGGSLL